MINTEKFYNFNDDLVMIFLELTSLGHSYIMVEFCLRIAWEEYHQTFHILTFNRRKNLFAVQYEESI